MSSMTKVVILSLFCSFGLTKVSNAFVMWDGHVDGSLHQYGVVYMDAVTWQEASDYLAAGSLGEGWQLATVTSTQEQSFIQSNLYESTNGRKFWLGGWQDIEATTANEGWNWVTGEAWDYTNWHYTQPDDYDGRVQRWLATDDLLNWQWADQTLDMSNLNRVSGFFIERSGDSVYVPEPSTFALLGIALIGFGFTQRNNARN